MIRMRRECPEIGWGDYAILEVEAPSVLGLRYDWRNAALVTLHNFSAEPVKATLEVDSGDPLVNLFADETIESDDEGACRVELEGYGYKWLRVGSIDEALDRTEF
jgi:maltose alpha-D-glucosyltransferase/alpha-amylase